MSEHFVPIRTYVVVFVALLVLTFVTVAVARMDLGEPDLAGVRLPLNVIVALTIACVKAFLVILFFMHAKYAGRLVQLVVASSFVWLFILIVITMSDYVSRGWSPGPRATSGSDRGNGTPAGFAVGGAPPTRPARTARTIPSSAGRVVCC
jgi:cytochrome c oxidase subunit 4